MTDKQNFTNFLPAILGIVLLLLIGTGIMVFSANRSKPAPINDKPIQNNPVVKTETATKSADSEEQYNQNQIPLTIISPLENSVASTPQITIKGQTLAKAEVFINDVSITADATGNFVITFDLEEGENDINITANDALGNYSEKELMITYAVAPVDVSDKTATKPGILLRANLNGTLASLSSTLAPTQLVLNVSSGKDNGMQVIVNVASTTKIIRKYNGTASLSELNMNDTLLISGKWSDQNKTFFDANVIKDKSIQKRNGVFFGIIKSSDSTTKTKTLTVATEKRGSQKITVSAETIIVNRKMEDINFTELKAGHKIRIKGLWNNKTNTITETEQIKDFSLPEKDDLLSTPTPTNIP